MSNRDKFPWDALEPGVPVRITLLYDRRPDKDDGLNQKGTKRIPWHLYPVEVSPDPQTGGIEERSMFTPNERLHEILQQLGINRRGQSFTLSMESGRNPKTKKAMFYYMVDYNGNRMSTRPAKAGQETTEKAQPAKPAAETARPASSVTAPVPQEDFLLLRVRKTLDVVVEEFKRYCPETWEDRSKRAPYLLEMFKSVLPLVSTQLINYAKSGQRRLNSIAPAPSVKEPSALLQPATKQALLLALKSQELRPEYRDKVLGALDEKNPEKVTAQDKLSEAQAMKILEDIKQSEQLKRTKEDLFVAFGEDEAPAQNFMQETLNATGKIPLEKLSVGQLQKLSLALLKRKTEGDDDLPF